MSTPKTSSAPPEASEGPQADNETQPKPPSSVSYIPISVVTVLLLICAYGFYASFSILQKSNITVVMPSNIEEIKILDDTFETLSQNHFWTTAVLFCSLYIIKQTFAIPGSLILNITSGRIFGVYLGFIFTTLCTTIGAGCCYALSYTFLQTFVKRCFPGRLAYLQSLVDKYRSDLLYYLVIMRAISFIPNWFVNLASPVLDIPIFTHTIAVGIGMAPYHWICSSAGSFLAEIESPSDIFDRSAIIKIAIVVAAAVIYMVLRKKYGSSDISKKKDE